MVKIIDETQRVDVERSLLAGRLGDDKKYRLSYLGGGDFIVHVMGVDVEMDKAVNLIEGEEVCDECK